MGMWEMFFTHPVVDHTLRTIWVVPKEKDPAVLMGYKEYGDYCRLVPHEPDYKRPRGFFTLHLVLVPVESCLAVVDYTGTIHWVDPESKPLDAAAAVTEAERILGLSA